MRLQVMQAGCCWSLALETREDFVKRFILTSKVGQMGKALSRLRKGLSKGFEYKQQTCRAFQVTLVVKNPPVNERDARDMGSIPVSGRSPGGGDGNPLQ